MNDFLYVSSEEKIGKYGIPVGRMSREEVEKGRCIPLSPEELWSVETSSSVSAGLLQGEPVLVTARWCLKADVGSCPTGVPYATAYSLDRKGDLSDGPLSAGGTRNAPPAGASVESTRASMRFSRNDRP